MNSPFSKIKGFLISLILHSLKKSQGLSHSRSKSKIKIQRVYEEKLMKLNLKKNHYKCKYQMTEKLLEKEKKQNEFLEQEKKSSVF